MIPLPLDANRRGPLSLDSLWEILLRIDVIEVLNPRTIPRFQFV